MWTISGPLDQEQPPGDGKKLDATNLKRKRLFPGRTYNIGRDADKFALALNSKQISHKPIGGFTVADCTDAQREDPSYTPELTAYCDADAKKPIRYSRGSNGDSNDIKPGTTETLVHDTLVVISGWSLTVRWEPIVVYFQQPKGKGKLDPTKFAPLGVFLVNEHIPQVTHHVTDVLDITAPVINSLVSPTQPEFVTRQWLEAMLADNTSLPQLKLPNKPNPITLSSPEQQFLLLAHSDYMPPFADTLKEDDSQSTTWTSSKERRTLFVSHHFFFAGEKGREVEKTVRAVVERAGGSAELFDASSGRTKFRAALKKAKKGAENVVLIADRETVSTAVGEATWSELLDEADAHQLQFIGPKRILNAILHEDLSQVDCSNASVLPPMTSEELAPLPEPTQVEEEPVPKKKKLTRLTRSTAPVQEPESVIEVDMAVDEGMPPPPPPKKPLVRLTGAAKTQYLGVDDPSMSFASRTESQSESEPVYNEFGFVEKPRRARTQSVARGGLKRLREESEDTQSRTLDQSFTMDAAEKDEPAFKKHKRLMEQTETQEVEEASQGGAEVADDYIFQEPKTQLGPLPEEEEEETQSQAVAPRALLGTKRKALETWGEEEEGGDRMDVDAAAGSSSKRQAVENVNAVKPVKTRADSKPPSSTLKAKPKSKAVEVPPHVAIPAPAPVRAASKPPSQAQAGPSKPKGGAAPGKPDTDAAFLKAVVSTKKGKKTEDQFDRDFNKLKISKPTLEGNEPEEDDYAVLGDFGKDAENVRGNFMNIVVMEHFERKQKQESVIRQDWQGKPDFKKFVKKGTVANKVKRVPVVLHAQEENDYGMGAAYWHKGSKKPAPAPLKQSNSAKSDLNETFLGVDEEEDAEQELPQPKASKSKPPAKSQTQTQKGKGRAFTVESEPEESDDDHDDLDIPLPPPSKAKGKARSRSASTQPQKKGTRTQPLFLDDDDIKEEEDEIEEDFEMSEAQPQTQTLRSTRSSSRAPTQRKAKAAPIIIIDDDSDDGATFKGFGKKKGKR